MTRLFLLLSITLAFLTSHILAQTWYDLTYYANDVTSFDGQLHVPALPHAGTYYLWYGLQPADNSGVYQGVLDGRSGAWWIAPGWCCENPSLPWGNGFPAGSTGDVINFSNSRNSTLWTSTVDNGHGKSAVSTFPLDDKVFNQAIFAIELYGQSWDFGPLIFTNIKIVSQGTDKSWCNSKPVNANNAATYTVSGVSASVKNGAVTCSIATLVLKSPASHAS